MKRHACLPHLIRSTALAALATAALCAGVAWAGESECRVAFDMGSSGIRAGASNSTRQARRDLDALAPLWAGRGIAALEPAVTTALRELPQEAAFDADCARVGGGFSAWRLALQQDPVALTEALRRIRSATGVAILVMPPRQEGAYGYFAARQALGSHLTTTHILDIGGGSLQIAGETRSFAAPLGQKSWHRLLCSFLRGSDDVPCALQPMHDRDLTRARALLAVRLADSGLPATTTLTAISRPVSRGVLPAVRRIAGTEGRPASGIDAADLRRTIDRLAPLDLATTAARVQGAERHTAFLLSDLLLAEGLMALTADRHLNVVERELDNLPGLLADDRAYAWRQRHQCYLERLRSEGIAAYDSTPETCPPDGR